MNMVKMKVVYQGSLRCNMTHGPSGQEIITDAPVDNMGKGEAFSPTDLMASALGACVLTVMGIVAERHQINMKGSSVDIEKEMVTQPLRRIGKITAVIHMASGIPKDKREMLERAAHTCPVHKSFHPDVHIEVTFHYPSE
jgi:putative redox protein